MLLNNKLKDISEQVTFCSAWVHVKPLQLCLTLCNRMDCNPPGSSMQGILQARTLEWVAMPSSTGSSRPRDRTCISYVSCTGRWVLDHWRHHTQMTCVHGRHLTHDVYANYMCVCVCVCIMLLLQSDAATEVTHPPNTYFVSTLCPVGVAAISIW